MTRPAYPYPYPYPYRIAFGPRAGQKVLTLRGVMPRGAGFEFDPAVVLGQ